MSRIRVEEPKKYIFSTELPVRISEINYGGHLGHDAILPITHEARVRFLEKLNYSEMDIGGYGIILSGVIIEYINEMFYGDVVVIKIGLSGFHKNGLDLIYQLESKNKNIQIARVLTSIIFFDYQNRKVVRTPDEVIKKFDMLSGI
jgi:acyl-CoA thioesterase FadM